MPFNIMDILMDKLFSPTKVRESPFLKTVSGLQNLLRENNSVCSTIPTEFHQALIESNFILSDFAEYSTSEAKDKSMDSLVSRLYKRAPHTSNFLQDCLNFFPHMSELSMMSEISTKPINMLSEVLMRQEPMFKKEYMSSIPKEIPDTLTMSVHLSKPSKQGLSTSITCVVNVKDQVKKDGVQMNSKKGGGVKCNNSTLNVELANRKTKELQKRSKKRRRRMKKDSSRTKKAPTHATCDQKSVSSGDILCDIVSSVRVNSVGLILPNITSFFFAVESASEDASDGETSNDCDWLAEFEVCGLFIDNLTSKPQSLPKDSAIRTILAEGGYEDKELTKLRAVLCEVNKSWKKATESIDATPRAPSKVTFPSDNKLAEVILVEVYDRKGEWERLATERIRFQRRIEEVSKVLSPCLTQSHREKVFSRISNSRL